MLDKLCESKIRCNINSFSFVYLKFFLWTNYLHECVMHFIAFGDFSPILDADSN